MKFELTRALVEVLHAHAEAEMPRECCGLVVIEADGSVVYLRARNLAANARDMFVLAPEDYAAAADRGEIAAIVHSHPNADANPSMADRLVCERSGLTWLIVGWPSGVIKRLEPEGWEAPYVGRTFHHGVLDCYTLIQDWYRRELQLELPEYEREDGWWECREGHPAQNLYMEHFAEAGFVQVRGEPRLHDVILMHVMSDTVNHGAIYEGDGQILHHLHSRLSERTLYGGYYQRHTVALLRHQSLVDVATSTLLRAAA